MRVRVKTELNIRRQAGATGTSYGLLKPGYEFDVEAVEQGGAYKDSPNKLWCRDRYGFYYWTGGLDLLDSAGVVVPGGLSQAVAARSMPAVPDTSALPWHIREFEIDKIWETTRGAGVRIAILDSGLNVDHPAFKGRVVFAKNYTGVGADTDVKDEDGHGTMCASMALGARVGGIAGVAPEADIMVGKVFRGAKVNDGEVEVEFLINAITDMVANGADVISISLSVENLLPALQAAIRRAVNLNVAVVAAAGNSFSFTPLTKAKFPGAFPEAVAVGALSKDGSPSPHSIVDSTVETFYGPSQDILVAAGAGQGSLPEPDGFTSIATAFLAGLVALKFSGKPKRSMPISRIKELLRNSSTTATPPNNQYMVNPKNFIN